MRILNNTRAFVPAFCCLLLFSNCKKESAKDLTKDFIGSYTGTARFIETSFPTMTSQTITDYSNCNITIQRSSRKTVWVTIKDDGANPVNTWSVAMEVTDMNHLGNLSNRNSDIPGYWNTITLENDQLTYYEEASELKKFTFHGKKD